MGQLSGRVAFITGAARGQGRSHAVRLAREGAAIVAVDICAQIDTVFYPMSTKADLEETCRLVEAEGGRISPQVADVRDVDQLQAAYDAGAAALGTPDVVVANAGIMPMTGDGAKRQAWHDGIGTMLTGVWHTLEVCVPPMVAAGRGGSIVITSSTAGLSGMGVGTLPGQAAYTAAKHGVVGLMRLYAGQLAEHSIRVNTVHPTAVNTPMVVNEGLARYSEENGDLFARFQNALPVPMVEPEDISEAVLYLVSDAGRYVTGVTLPVDAGFLVRS